MSPLFKFVSSHVYFPHAIVSEHGEVLEPNGVDLLDAEQAAARLNVSADDLARAWRECFTISDNAPSDSELIVARERFMSLAFGNVAPEVAEAVKAELAAMNLLDAFVAREVWIEQGESAPVLCTTIAFMESRVLADGLLNGGVTFQYRAEGSTFSDHWDDQTKGPYECEATCYRTGVERPFSIRRLRSEVFREGWYHTEMPVESLSKCTRAALYRHAFRDRLGSLYLREEISGRKKPAKLKLADAEPELDVSTRSGCMAWMTKRGISEAMQAKFVAAVNASGLDEFSDANYWLAVQAYAQKHLAGTRRRS